MMDKRGWAESKVGKMILVLVIILVCGVVFGIMVYNSRSNLTCKGRGGTCTVVAVGTASEEACKAAGEGFIAYQDSNCAKEPSCKDKTCVCCRKFFSWGSST